MTAWHSEFLNGADATDVYWSVVYNPYPATDLDAASTAGDGAELGFLPPKYTERGWINPATGDLDGVNGEELYAREIKEYQVWRSTSPTSGWDIAGTVAADYDNDAVTNTLKPRANGNWVSGWNKITFDDNPGDGLWYYAVTSTEHSGLGSDELSEIIQVTISGGQVTSSQIVQAQGQKDFYNTAPAAPFDFTATQASTAGHYELSWSEPGDAKIRYYNVYYSTAGDPIADQSERIASLTAGTDSYLDWLADPDITGFYGITSVDRYGNESPIMYAGGGGNNPPTATGDAYDANEGTPLSVSAANGVLANDTDADQDTLTASLESGPSHGIVALNANGSFTYTPNAGFIGTDSFTYRANDAQDDSNVATVTLNVTALPAVIARHIFYNNSKWDGHAGFEAGDPAANAFDDAAIAIDKQALLPGETATFANYTSYPRGINGIIVDVQGLADPDAVADGDFGEFTFKVGNSNDPTQWLPAAYPVDVAVRDLSGGVYRVTFIWADNAIPNKNWLQLTVKAHAATGLAEDDVSYYGCSIGENTGDFKVDYDDAFNNIWPSLFTPNPIGVDHVADVTRDGRIDYDDVFVGVWPNLFAPSPLKTITAPQTPPSLLESTDFVLDENVPWAIELMWFDELYGSSTDSEEDEDDVLEATAVDGVFMMYSEE